MEEKTAQTTAEWVFVARSLAQVPDSRSQALSCMARAQLLVDSASDLIALTRAWSQDFNDADMARQCLVKAESWVEECDDSDEWPEIAETWVAMGDYPQAARIYREWFEPMPWPYLAQLKPLAEAVPGTSVLDWVEPGMSNRASQDLAMEAEENLSNNPAMAVHLLVSAESLAYRSNDWIRIARIWREKFQCLDNAKWCMEKAEDAVDDRYDWLRIIRIWKEDFQDLGQARRCISEVEKYSYGYDDWLQVAKAWKQDFQDSDNAIRCMLEAEDTAEDSEDWTEILEVWKNDFQDLDNYNRCFSKAYDDSDIE